MSLLAAVASWERQQPDPENQMADTKPNFAKSRSKSGYFGVGANGAKWYAKLTTGSERHHLGTFRTKEEAAAAYDAAARKYQGDAAMCNFPSEQEADQIVAAAILAWEADQSSFVAQQAKPRPRSGYFGVGAEGSNWSARIGYDGKQHHLGTFRTKEEAAASFDTAARKQKGSDALCNFESEALARVAVEAAILQWQKQHPVKPKPRPKSGYYGVSANRSRWYASINYSGKTEGLGSFNTKEEAAAVHDTAARKHKGALAICNFETEEIAAAAVAAAIAQYLQQNPPKAAEPKPRPRSGYYGVYPNRSKWYGQIQYSGKKHSLGTFHTKEEAAAAFDIAARKYKDAGAATTYNYASIEEAEAAAEMAKVEWEKLHPPQPSQPMQLRPKPKSGYYGVHANNTKWSAEIRYGGKKHKLGTFRTKEEAASAFDTAAREFKSEESLAAVGTSCNFADAAAAEAAVATAVADWERLHPPQPKPRPSSGHYGVHANKSKWQAHICYGGEKYNLGTFRTKEEASQAYDLAAREHISTNASAADTMKCNYGSTEAAEAAVREAVAEWERTHPPQPKPRPMSGFLGVNAHGHRWQAKFNPKNGEQKYNVGTFNTKEEAAAAYDVAARERQGVEFNFESEEEAAKVVAEKVAEWEKQHQQL